MQILLEMQEIQYQRTGNKLDLLKNIAVFTENINGGRCKTLETAS